MVMELKLPKNKSKDKLPLIVFAFIVGFIGLFMLIQSFAAETPPNAPTVYLSPQSQTFAANTTFTVDLREDSGTTPVNAVQANFTYPATLIDFVSIDTSIGPFTTVAESTGASGQVKIGVGTAAGSPAVTGNQLIAKVTFKTKTTGGSIAMAFSSGTELINSTTFANLITSLSLTRGSNYSIDTTAPTVSVSSPANGATVTRGTTTTISINASDNTAVSTVDLYIDDVLKSAFSTSPYSYNWNTSGVSLGSHTIYAVAKDAYGNSKTSATITVSLVDNVAPTVSVSSPVNGATVKDTIAVSATATDNSDGTGVDKVEFYIDDILKSTDTTSPYAYPWDSKSVSDGSHTIKVKAYDKATPVNSATSATITVSVDNADKTAPSTPTNFKVSASTTDSISLSWTASTDNIGVTGYKISRNGSLITTATQTTFKDVGLNPDTSYSYSIVAVDAAGNVSPATTLSAKTQPIKIGDFDNDNSVDIQDLAIFLSKYGTTDSATDLNKNGAVDIVDLAMFLANYGK
jgi:hypothetical protein